MRTCTKCLASFPDDFFSWKIKGRQRSAVCKDCHRKYRKEHYEANRQYYIDKAKKYVSENGGKAWETYRLTPEAFEALKSKYGGLCWSCQEVEGYAVDHDHSCCPGRTSCGECVRGWLCRGCNSGLGYFRDDPSKLLKAVEYLKKTK